jgi:hypothetical protein
MELRPVRRNASQSVRASTARSAGAIVVSLLAMLSSSKV